MWKHFRLNDKIGEYGNRNKPRVEGRLQEVYRKFAEMIDKHREEFKEALNLG